MIPEDATHWVLDDCGFTRTLWKQEGGNWFYFSRLSRTWRDGGSVRPRHLTRVDVVDKSRSRSDGSSADYYVLPDGATQLQHLISHKNMNAQVGEIFRACYRYGEVAHSEMLRDAKKIKFYAEAEIERLEKLNEKA